ncbi:hypothetical protein A0H81_06888 [Grifola frondosa]|uniref:Uncharacterized protein n=1 Tax=Grifola frondosa TaxID=5627 RepID=A0A1C7MCX3_GRIFR|nr:hypothetical protein A0H81_06888 [Grifola frondosa]
MSSRIFDSTAPSSTTYQTHEFVLSRPSTSAYIEGDTDCQGWFPSVSSCEASWRHESVASVARGPKPTTSNDTSIIVGPTPCESQQAKTDVRVLDYDELRALRDRVTALAARVADAVATAGQQSLDRSQCVAPSETMLTPPSKRQNTIADVVKVEESGSTNKLASTKQDDVMSPDEPLQLCLFPECAAFFRTASDRDTHMCAHFAPEND